MPENRELAQKLLELNEDVLKAQLGIRAQQVSEDATSRSASLESLDEDLSTVERGISLRIIDIEFGNRLFEQLNVKSYDLMCGNFLDDADLNTKVLDAFKKGSDQAAALLAPILASHLGLASSIAMIVAVLLVKALVSATSTVSSATSDTICGIWKTTLVE